MSNFVLIFGLIFLSAIGFMHEFQQMVPSVFPTTSFHTIKGVLGVLLCMLQSVILHSVLWVSLQFLHLTSSSVSFKTMSEQPFLLCIFNTLEHCLHHLKCKEIGFSHSARILPVSSLYHRSNHHYIEIASLPSVVSMQQLSSGQVVSNTSASTFAILQLWDLQFMI